MRFLVAYGLSVQVAPRLKFLAMTRASIRNMLGIAVDQVRQGSVSKPPG